MNSFIKVPRGGKVVVVGDIHEHSEQFNKLIEEIKPSEKLYLAFVGDIYDKGFGIDVAEEITDSIIELVKAGYTFIIKGNHELKHIRNEKKKNKLSKQLTWFDAQPLSLCFEFTNRTLLTVVHGGIKPGHTRDDLDTDVEICYIRQLDEHGEFIKMIKKVVDGMRVMVPAKSGGKLWHESYNGRFGYIASGHNSQKDGLPKFYNYSCNLDTACYHTGKLTAQIFSEKGREDLLTFEGNPKYPDINDMYRGMARGKV